MDVFEFRRRGESGIDPQTESLAEATGLKLALLINFNVAVLKDGIKRVVNSR